jgi:hypothetical protein
MDDVAVRVNMICSMFFLVRTRAVQAIGSAAGVSRSQVVLGPGSRFSMRSGGSSAASSEVLTGAVSCERLLIMRENRRSVNVWAERTPAPYR